MLTIHFLFLREREGTFISVESETLSTSKFKKNSKAEAVWKGTWTAPGKPEIRPHDRSEAAPAASFFASNGRFLRGAQA